MSRIFRRRKVEDKQADQQAKNVSEGSARARQMSRGQIALAILLLLSIVSCFLPWLTANVNIGGEDRSTTNYGYNYVVPIGVRYAAPVAILNIIGFILSAYSFKATENLRKLNVIAGILILVGAIVAFVYTSSAAIGEATGSSNFSVNVSAEYGMGLEVLFGLLIIIVAWRTEPARARAEPEFRGEKEERKTQVVSRKTISELEQLSSGDREIYEALAQTMFLDPRKIETPMKQAVENAKKSEKEGDLAKAGMWCEVAGGLAIYEGNVKKVVEYYGEAQRILHREYAILRNPEKAVALAQEYYKKFLLA